MCVFPQARESRHDFCTPTCVRLCVRMVSTCSRGSVHICLCVCVKAQALVSPGTIAGVTRALETTSLPKIVILFSKAENSVRSVVNSGQRKRTEAKKGKPSGKSSEGS